MARPNLAMNVKFKRALQMLRVPRPHLRGYLEEMWDTAYADGNPLLGDAAAVEATWPDIEQGEWRSQVTPSAALGSLLGWVAMGLPVVMAGGHRRAGRYVSRLLYIVARRRWRELRTFAQEVDEAKEDEVA